ncbi:hypothetical protein GCM10027589_22470 [Actinocorallia lasiicapitis]
MSKARRIVAAGTGSVLLLGALSACAQASPFNTVKDFLIAWEAGKYDDAAKLTDSADRAGVANALRDVRTQLDAASLRLRLKAEPTSGAAEAKGRVDRPSDDEAVARFNVRIDLGENGRPWSYISRMPLQRTDGKWKVVWSPAIIHESLKPGGRLAVVSEFPARQQIFDVKGQSLLKMGRNSLIEVLPREVTDADAVAKAISKATEMDAGRIRGRILSAPPNKRLLLATLTANDPKANGLNALPGVYVTVRELRNEPRMAKELVGAVGPATTDLLAQVGAPYQPGDTIGQSGLQLRFQRRLAGTPTVKIVSLDANGTAKELKDFGAEDVNSTAGGDASIPKPVRTTIDPRLQAKAENALRGLALPASIVTVKGQTGRVVAVANVNTGGVNKAFLGQYAPGTTFSPMLASPMLADDSALTRRQPCPAQENVSGVELTSPQQRAKSTVGANLASGCGTGIATLAGGLDQTNVDSVIRSFGLDVPWELSGVPHAPPVITAPTTEADKVNMMVGKSGIAVSPLTMALIASAIQTNGWAPPQLITDPVPEAGLDDVRRLQPGAWTNLSAIMEAGARRGGSGYNISSAKRLQGGVTATVTQDDGKTVSWFVGYNKDSYGFAIAVEGNYPMARLAAEFLNAPYELQGPVTPVTPTVPTGQTPA